MSPKQQADAPGSDETRFESIQAQVRWHLASRGRIGGPFILLATLAHGLVTGFGLDQPLIFGAALGIGGLGVLTRLQLVRRFDEWSAKNPDRWHTGFRVTSFLLALSLGAYAFGNIAIEGASPGSILTLLAACASAAGAMSVLHADTACYRIFVLSSLLPPAVICIATPDPIARTTGFLILIFLVYLIVTGMILHVQYIDLLESRQLLAERGTELERARHSADAASRAKSEFLANMSHEIRTPLSGVLGMTRMALETPDARERDEFLDLALRSGDSLLNIINDILDLSKIEAGKLTLHPTSFDLRELVGATLQMLAHRARGRPLDLVWEVDDSVPARLWGDSNRLRQILINLAGNAVKFTPTGEIAIHFTAERGDEGEIVVLGKVRDTGIGIAPDRQSAIFEAFQQAGHDAKLDSRGTGLGLSICSRLVELMGGRIWVESEEGRGSTFHFEVHLSGGRLRDEGTPAPDTGGIQARIALWKAHPTAVATLSRLIRESGAHCETFADLDAVLSACASGGYDLAIVELPKNGDLPTILERVASTMDETRLPLLLLQPPGEEMPPGVLRRNPFFRGRILEPVIPSLLREAIHRVLAPLPPASPRPVVELSAKSSASLHVLVAEDNRVNQMLVEAMLKKLGHSMQTVADGEAAVGAFERQRFDLILMDIQMPRLSGIEATREIRKREDGSGRRTPIVALTADVVESTESRCREAGMDAYLLKPFSRDEIRKMIEQFVPAPVDGDPVCPL